MRVPMKWVVIAFAIVALGFQFFIANFNAADDDLKAFYLDVLSANFSDACGNINSAIRLWPSNGRYYGWRAYCVSQELPSQCLRHSARKSGLSDQARAIAEAALKDYRRDLELNGRDAVAYHDRAWIEHLLGDDVAADKDWREATTVDPGNAMFHLSYGMWLEESRDLQAAKAQYQVAIEISPAILDSPFFSQYRNRSPEAADSITRQAALMMEEKLHQGKDPVWEARLGKLYHSRGDLPRARQLLEDASQQLPNLPLVWLNLGEIHEGQGDSAQAMACYRKALAVDASIAEAYLDIGELELQRGQKKEAAQDLQMAIQKWQRVNPITAAHNNRLYAGPRQMIDDLLPTTLVWYTTPCQASRAWQGLSRLFPGKQQYANRSQMCEQVPSPHLFGGLK